jgi:ABC-type antimicrobial peptide transport system permease subunit
VSFALLRGVIAAVVASVVGLYIAYALGALTASGFPVSGFGPALISMVIIGLVVTATFMLVLGALKSPELREALRALASLRARGSRE